PYGRARAEAAGVDEAHADGTGRLPQSAAVDPAFITAVRERLAARGAYLPGVVPRTAIGATTAEHYGAFRVLVSRGLSVGGYDNDPRLASDVSSLSFAYLLSNVEIGRAHV